MSVTGEDGRPPVRVAPAIIDQGTAMWMVIGILAALAPARRNRQGRRDRRLALRDRRCSGWAFRRRSILASDEVPRADREPRTAASRPTRPIETKDGWVVISCRQRSAVHAPCEALGHPEWASDPRTSARNPERVKNRERINALIADVVRTQTREPLAIDARCGGRALRAGARSGRGAGASAEPRARHAAGRRPTAACR